MRRNIGIKALLTMLAMVLLTVAPAQTLPRETREAIISASVLILAGDSLGSGTLISPLGYILTNYHVIGDTQTRTIAPKLVVGIIKFVDQPPEVKYIAQVVQADPLLDLAVIKITHTTNGQPVGALNLPAVPIGNSNDMVVGDPIFVFGFQGTGGYTLSFSRGSIGGFTGEDREGGGKQWIKHDAQTGPGNSGGGVFNEKGELIGIHTAGVSGNNNSRTAFMRPVALAWGIVGPNVDRLVRGSGNANNGGNNGGGGNSGGGGGNSGGGGSWPPKVNTGQVWQVQVQGGQYTGSWTVTVNKQDADGDFEGLAVSGSRRLDALFFQRENILRLNFGFDYPYARCRFDPQALNGPIQGKLYLFKDANSDSQEIGTCVANAGGSAAVGGGSNTGGGNVGGGGSAAWPPKTAVGQRWNVAFSGEINDSGVLSLTQLDSEGDPKGTVTFGNNFQVVAYFYLGKSSGDMLLDLTPVSGDRSHVDWWRCKISRQNSTALSGKLQRFQTDKDGNISNLKDIGTCTVTPGR